MPFVRPSNKDFDDLLTTVTKPKNFGIQGYAVDHAQLAAAISKKIDLEFEKLKKFVPGSTLVLAKIPSKYGADLESQRFLVRKLDEAERAIHLSPIKGHKVADVTARFTTQEIKKFKVTAAPYLTEDDLSPQKDQIIDHRPQIQVQGYYDE